MLAGKCVINNSISVIFGPMTVLCSRRDSREEVFSLKEIVGWKPEGGACGQAWKAVQNVEHTVAAIASS